MLHFNNKTAKKFTTNLEKVYGVGYQFPFKTNVVFLKMLISAKTDRLVTVVL